MSKKVCDAYFFEIFASSYKSLSGSTVIWALNMKLWWHVDHWLPHHLDEEGQYLHYAFGQFSYPSVSLTGYILFLEPSEFQDTYLVNLLSNSWLQVLCYLLVNHVTTFLKNLICNIFMPSIFFHFTLTCSLQVDIQQPLNILFFKFIP